MVNAEGMVGGNVTLFQTSEMRLFVTFQMFCPYVLRSSVEGTNAPYSAALYAWEDLSLQVRGGRQLVDVTGVSLGCEVAVGGGLKRGKGRKPIAYPLKLGFSG